MEGSVDCGRWTGRSGPGLCGTIYLEKEALPLFCSLHEKGPRIHISCFLPIDFDGGDGPFPLLHGAVGIVGIDRKQRKDM